MKKVSIFLAEGFEEVEALTPADVLRRAGAEVTLVAVGGMPGTLHLKECSPLVELLKGFCGKGKKVAAICAAPTVLGEAGLLKGRKATCYPGCEDGLKGAEVLTDRVVIDGNITTSRGVGTAIPFALSLTAQLFDQNKADEIRESIVYGHGPAKN